MKLILISLFLTKYNPLAPLDVPVNSSPIIRSLVLDVGPSIEPRTQLGDCGSSVPNASKIP